MIYLQTALAELLPLLPLILISLWYQWSSR